LVLFFKKELLPCFMLLTGNEKSGARKKGRKDLTQIRRDKKG
jgi:hypothetical protein